MDKHKGVPIIFIDKKEALENCFIPSIYDRNVSISRDSLLIDNIDPAYFIIYDIKQYQHEFILTIHFKFSGAHGNIKMRKTTNKIKIKKFEIEFF